MFSKIILGLSALVFAGASVAAPIDGTWEITITTFGDPEWLRATIETSGDKITGSADEMKISGTTRGETVQFEIHHPDGSLYGTFSGTLLNTVLVGTAKLPEGESASWTARHPAERPAGAPRLHNFRPREFHRTFSSLIPPVLHIYAGDTVETWTVDAGGKDAKMARRSNGGNPLTGPFYIEGALPGDTLVVKFTRIRLNRDSAESGDSIVPSLVGPFYFKNAKGIEKFDSTWRLDREKGVAMLGHPSDRLKNFSVKLDPMLGCVGVAPAGKQSLRAGNLGSYGGNMDYNQIREGVTLYLPVYHAGALLFVGDGHAAQGDGELTGDALETSMDVAFVVDVIKGRSSRMPRAENADYLMAIGIGGSLADAVQTATTELARWIERDYKLNSTEAAVVLGTSIRYDIAELVDPQVNVVAKVAKSVLAQLPQ